MKRARLSGQRQKHLLLEWIWDFMVASSIAFALGLDMDLRAIDNYSNWFASMPETMSVSVIGFSMLYILRHARVKLHRLGWRSVAASLFLGAWWVVARSVNGTMNLNQPFLTKGQMLKSFVSMMGAAGLYDLLFRLLCYGLEERMDWQAEALKHSRIAALYRKHTVLFCTVVLLVAWLPHLIISYPVSMNNDTRSQVEMVLGMRTFDENHPLLGTAGIELFLKIGELFGAARHGLYLYMVLQVIFGAAVLGYSQQIMRKLNAPCWLRTLSLLVCATMPVYSDNITVILKDVPYTYAIVLLLCEMIRLVYLREEDYWKTKGFLMRWLVASFVMLAIRNNGMGVLAPMLLVMAIYALRGKNYRMVVCFALLVFLPSVLISGLKDAYREGKETFPVDTDGGLSIVLQQTGRFVGRHWDEIPADERAVIEKVMDYEKIPGGYNPILSDAMKRAYYDDTTNEELLEYLKVWAKQFMRDPVCYIEATLIQNALLFDPQTFNVAIMRTGLKGEAAEVLGVVKPRALERAQEMEARLRLMLFSIPGVLQLNLMGFYNILLLGIAVIAGKRKTRGVMAMTVPAWATFVMVILGSTIVNQDRYGFPIVYCMPLMLSCLSCALQKKQTGNVN